ncbi:hypothetical protein HD806DRAFT_524990 [Xylariaceae sp. AK1471]|nr:hypothetical protein HD806DRAFT_524990 [Xylariaceae sp. AK1471]
MPGNSSSKGTNHISTRTMQACNHCRQRKSRCDGKSPCSFCEKHAINCTYELSQRRRGPGRSKEYIRALEARLRDATLSEPLPSNPGQAKSTASQSPEPTAAISDSNKLNAVGGDAAIHAPIEALGPESASSDASRQTAGSEEEIPDSTPPFLKPLITIANGSHGFASYLAGRKSSISKHSSRLQIFSPLVLTNEIIKFLEPVFDDLTSGYPFLSWPLFVDHLSNMDPVKNPAWRALLDSVMAIAMLFRSANSDLESAAKDAWTKFRNAYTLLPQLIALDPEILAVEAVLAMAIFMKLSTDARTAAQLVSSAVKMYQMIVLQNDPSRTLILGASDDRHRRAFWTAYILDMEISSQCGLPSTVDDDEFGVVAEMPKINVHMQGLSPALQIRSEIAIIESIIYKRLYKRKAFEQSDSELVPNIVEIDWGFGYWQQTVSSDLRPDPDNPAAKPVADMGTLMLHFAYYNSVSMAHWAARRHGSRNDASNRVPSDQIENVQVASSIEKSKKAARATLNLLRALPQRPFVDLWRILCYPISASMTLLIGVLEDPLSACARPDISIIRSFRQFLEKAIREDCCDLHWILQGCLQIEKLAENAVVKAEDQSTTKSTDGIDGRSVPRLWDDALSRQAQIIKDTLGSCTHPMYVAQGLMTNMQNRDSAATRVLSEVLGISEKGDRQTWLLAPEY